MLAAVALLVALGAHWSGHGHDEGNATAAQIAQAARQRALEHAASLLAASAPAAGAGVPVVLDLPGGSGDSATGYPFPAANGAAGSAGASPSAATTITPSASAYAPDDGPLHGAQPAPGAELPPPVHLTPPRQARIPDAIEGSAALPTGSDVLSTLTIETRLRVLDGSACPFLLLATQVGDGTARAQLQWRLGGGAAAAGAAWYERGEAPAPGWQLIDVGVDAALLLTPQGNPLRLQRSLAPGASVNRQAP